MLIWGVLSSEYRAVILTAVSSNKENTAYEEEKVIGDSTKYHL